MRLVMTILVKNEDDIIEDNIRFHSAQGVDAFYIMDNASTDETLDIVKKLSLEFDITYEVQDKLYDQGPWMTFLAKKARRLLGADFVISNDADEFWVNNLGNGLKDCIKTDDSIVTVERYNYIATREQFEDQVPYYDFSNKVVSPILYSRAHQLDKPGLSMLLLKNSPKIIVSPKGLIKIKGGNHRGKHFKFWNNRGTSDIEVHHYPIRSYKQFEGKIFNRMNLLNKDPNIRMGVHYKRWVKLLEQGELKNEFSRMSYSRRQMSVMKEIGIVDDVLSSPLKSWKG